MTYPLFSLSTPLSLAEAVASDNVERLAYPLTPAQQVKIPLFAAKIPAGFPSPADEYLEATIDLNEHLVIHPAATFFVRVKGHSMTGAGIHHGDLLVVDRALQAQSGSIVIAVVNGELTVKRLWLKDKDVWLLPENAEFKPIAITDGMELHIWGVVAHVIHSF